MLDPQILRKNLALLKDNINRRGLDIDINFLVEQDEKRRKVKFEAEQVRSEQKSIGKEISQTEGSQKKELLEKASELSEKVKLLMKNMKKKISYFLING